VAYDVVVVRRPSIRKSLGLAILLAIVLAGCSTPTHSVSTPTSTAPKVILNVATYSHAVDTSATSPHGIVAGRAWPCSGVYEGGDVTVLVFLHGHLAAQESVPSGDHFSFRLPPGTYQLTNDGGIGPHTVGPHTVIVRPLPTTSLDIPNSCI
jgi:hypothetical protein